ncbi:hypothetical protein ABID23_000197 [Bartonella silvatica]|uniref:DUF2125 domain-containing protein n=2 Tax=Bartonella silvatica TaxID=357760 RepID=A0ABV2HFD9_9HYPH
MAVVCEHLRKDGYPLRIGVACDQFQFAWPLRGLSASSGHLTIGTPTYAPHLLEFNVHSPASIVISGKTPIVSHWRNLAIETEPYQRMSKTFKLMVEGLEISTMTSSLEDQNRQGKFETQIKNKGIMQKSVGNQESSEDALNVTVPSLDSVSSKMTAEFLRFDLKQEENHLSGRLTFDDLDPSMFFSPYLIDFPKVDGHLKWTFDDVSHLLKNRGGSWKQHLYGKSGVLKSGELAFHTGGVLRASGPFSFDDKGYLTAKFELIVVKHMELLTTMQRLFPEQANNLQALFFVVGAMPKNADGFPVVILHISHGWMKLGFLKLGRLAPL